MVPLGSVRGWTPPYPFPSATAPHSTPLLMMMMMLLLLLLLLLLDTSLLLRPTLLPRLHHD